MEEAKKNGTAMQAPEELAAQLKKALGIGEYFITISFKEGSPPGDLKHRWFTKSYPKEDLIKTLDFLKDDITNKELRKDKKEEKGQWV